MSAGRRLALLEYARRHDSWIIEDDYDSEFRYSGEPIPAMLGMARQAPVVYLGTFQQNAISGAAHWLYGDASRAGGGCTRRHWCAITRRAPG